MATSDWWKSFGSSELSEFVDKALVDNRDLAVAVARVNEAHAQTTIQRAALFPRSVRRFRRCAHPRRRADKR